MSNVSPVISLSGQTYTRKLDYKLLSMLSGLAQSAHKMCTDLRLLAHLNEVEEPFDSLQVGSSAMAYKRNPMKCERVCSLARYLMNLSSNAAQTHANQWLERTLDDSANRRMVIPEAFFTADAMLSVVHTVLEGLVVRPEVIERRVLKYLPFMATEAVLMECVRNGGDRQVLHEALRVHSQAASERMKAHGAENDLWDRIESDLLFAVVHGKRDEFQKPRQFVGRAPQQVMQYLNFLNNS